MWTILLIIATFVLVMMSLYALEKDQKAGIFESRKAIILITFQVVIAGLLGYGGYFIYGHPALWPIIRRATEVYFAVSILLIIFLWRTKGQREKARVIGYFTAFDSLPTVLCCTFLCYTIFLYVYAVHYGIIRVRNEILAVCLN